MEERKFPTAEELLERKKYALEWWDSKDSSEKADIYNNNAELVKESIDLEHISEEEIVVLYLYHNIKLRKEKDSSK